MLNKLVRGKKYTIVGNDGFLEFRYQVTLLDYMYKQYAQYGDAPYIKFKFKGGRKIYTMFLTYKYSFIEGWQDIKLSKKIDENTYERIKYDDLKIDNIVVSGQLGTVETYKNYEGLIDYSVKLIEKYGLNSTEYKKEFKEIFTRLNYSLNTEMINYYKKDEDYFLKTLDTLE